MDTEEQINDIIAKLNAVQDIIIAYDKKTMLDPNMDVSEWNSTPIGRAVHMLGTAMEMLEALEV